MSGDLATRLAGVLAEHASHRIAIRPGEPWAFRGVYRCLCGEEFNAVRGADGANIGHRAHLAAILAGLVREERAEAFDEGGESWRDNPYREATP